MTRGIVLEAELTKNHSNVEDVGENYELDWMSTVDQLPLLPVDVSGLTTKC